MSGARFPNALTVVLAHLRAARPDVNFGTEEPKPEVDGGPDYPYVMVGLDFSYGQPQSNPVKRIANMRLVAWEAYADDAEDLVQECEDVLLSFAGDSQVQRYREIAGPLPYPNDGNPICVVTFAAHLRPNTL